MLKQLLIFATLLISMAPLSAQDQMQIDPEAMKFIQNQQQQTGNIPPEILALMPVGLKVTEKTWYVEPMNKMLLTLALESHINSTKLENNEVYDLELKIAMTAYNMKSDVGKMSADNSLKEMRQGAQNNWLDAHPESSSEFETIYTPEKIVLSPKSFILTQKTFAPAHDEGEGRVPESTHYTGYLYLEVEGGFLTSEVQQIPNTKAGIEKWLRYISTSTGKLDLNKYFN
jgi:hypothetical protein